MNTITYIFGIIVALLALFAIIELMRKGTLRERHALWWFIGGLLALTIAVFPQTLTWASKVIGVAVPSNLVFFVAIALLFLVSLQYGAELTRIEARMRSLSEQAAFTDQRLRTLESERSHPTEAGGRPEGPNVGDEIV
ncbi:hypothetical protein MHM582_1112 [Microbacterium sp. HM58-2]|nr:hypothetical protein MHM582_1112 [Microbacterium sp. HM58-2]